MKDTFEHQFSEYKNQIPEYDSLIKNIFSMEKELERQQYLAYDYKAQIDKALEETDGCKIVIVDFHAEATAEKRSMGYYLDGRVTALLGTHTHVQTADAQILPEGTAYITDVGMCGESGGVLGMDAECVVSRMRSRLPVKFAPSKGDCEADGVVFTFDTSSRRVTAVERVKI